MVAAVTFGILPALRGLRINPQSALQANSMRAANSCSKSAAKQVKPWTRYILVHSFRR
jgi:hypothetical protein